jgi:hypothetical protein
MEDFPYSDDPLRHDPVYARAMELIDQGLSRGQPLYEAAAEICRDEKILRDLVLNDSRRIGSVTLFNSELFPPDIFNPDGSRQLNEDGTERLTAAEARAQYELAESQRYTEIS